MKNRIVSIGDLVTDYYYIDNKILGVCGGMSTHNIAVNLANMGLKTCILGANGNDIAGEIAKKSLEDNNVDTSYIRKIQNIDTRIVHISYIQKDSKLVLSSKLNCPFCNKIKWYKTSLLETSYILNNIKEDDILIFDSLNQVNKEIIKNTNNIKLIDIGHTYEFDNININDLKDSYNSKFTIININNKVYEYILNKYKLTNFSDFNKIFNAKLTIITKGKDGADFMYNKKTYKYKLDKIIKEKDPTGAGDAFFSSIIYDFINNRLQIDETKFDFWFKNATILTSKVVTCIGARSHINNLYNVKKEKDFCLCEKFKLDIK